MSEILNPWYLENFLNNPSILSLFILCWVWVKRDVLAAILVYIVVNDLYNVVRGFIEDRQCVKVNVDGSKWKEIERVNKEEFVFGELH